MTEAVRNASAQEGADTAIDAVAEVSSRADEAAAKPVFYGKYSFKVDAKGRVSIPSDFRKFYSDKVVITKSIDGKHLMVFGSDAEFRAWIDGLFETKFNGFDPYSTAHGAFMRKLNGMAQGVEIDASGRVLLPADHRNKLGIEKEVVVLGNCDTVEIWKPETLAAEENEIDLSVFLMP